MCVFDLGASLIMELMSLEDDDGGLFLTQTPKNGIKDMSNMELLEDSFNFGDVFNDKENDGGVGNMEYSDISETENTVYDESNQIGNPTFE